MKRFFTCLVLSAALVGCGGIPLRSLPRLVQLSGQLLEADPAQFTVALQVDARVVPPPGAVPLLHIQLKPKVEGAFAPVDRKLPLAMTTATSATLGLDAPGPGRRWLVYSLPPATQAELRKVQAMVKQAQAQPGYQRGGTLALGVEQKDLAVTDPALSRTRWDTWLQVRQSEGFFEVWSGTPEQLRQAAQQR
ncbi:hypothetical protein KIH07_21810 [Hydrogenophaga taeniospiralis]|uniref:hypothetical protein n=1 Tax=Hydrogenophaga taeniospiralis TaxID=65656 RepID=UPI0008B2581F|nr:hypothetical protein [Hydrogenophaga taeniospiralis]MCB4366379.1 hypothetical protein [Hydrogenophaga taeniospiralis]OGB15430.1 MAG: hypothetical protein A3I64_20730 [Burkholderiales bacterium RIFCSPLOWO2_02_FULL_67_64]OGB36091.1 MAG: hypothetical protein A3E51_13135 [Burkholderiales bacterium RIFCSPHIGHO2_12_FULL_67_38]OGB42580.1 MAG: hypothetical protein A2W72_07915 [Burkholderiales bacterium RIFCSPLOWO2_12_67_14]